MATSIPASQPTALQPPLVEVLAFPGCPNRDAAISLAERVCAEVAGNAEIQVIDITDQQAAEQARSLGSPTIRVDGRDVEPGAEHCVEYLHTCRLYQGQHSLRGLPEEAWLRQALHTAQARRELDGTAMAAEIAALLDQLPAADWLGTKLNHLLSSFFHAEIRPQAMRAAELGIDPRPWLDVVAAVLRKYADALEHPERGNSRARDDPGVDPLLRP
ncbi:MAG TPA: hypothetical protein VJS86_18570 [Arthrobacter sp.]|nr:hypothetical protein [Arthrobacter sp.]